MKRDTRQNDDLPDRLRAAARERTVTDPRAAALLIEAADAYDKIVWLWVEQTASAGHLAGKLAEVDTERLKLRDALEQAREIDRYAPCACDKCNAIRERLAIIRERKARS